MTTKKLYVEIAEIIGQHMTIEYCVPVQSVAEALAELFKKDNPSFNTDRFLVACGILP